MSAYLQKEWLIHKFEEIRRRILKALEQLDDEQVNWRPNEQSFSIAQLIRHIDGNRKERVAKGILGQTVERNRQEELAPVPTAKSDLVQLIDDCMQMIINTLNGMTDADFDRTQAVRSRERSNLDMLLQCTAHYSEHMGQIFYIAKQQLGERYVSTSI